MSSLRLWCVVIALLVSYLPGIARADRDKAKAHYQRGTSYYNLSRYGEALKEYEAAYLEYPDPVFLFNIGQCYRKLGQAEKAIQSYRNYLRNAEDAPNRRDVEERIRELEASLEQAGTASTAATAVRLDPTPAKTSSPAVLPASPAPVVTEAAMPPVPAPALVDRAGPQATRETEEDGVPAWLVWGGIGAGVIATVAVVFLLSRDGSDRPMCPEGIRCY